jgi:hypothetical protein
MSSTYELKPSPYLLFVITRPWAWCIRFYAVVVCFDQAIIVWVFPPNRSVFRHRGFEETCSIHRQLLEFDLYGTPAARKMVAVHVYSTELYRRAKLRDVASRKTKSRPHVFNLLTVSVSIAHNVECMLLHV